MKKNTMILAGLGLGLGLTALGVAAAKKGPRVGGDPLSLTPEWLRPEYDPSGAPVEQVKYDPSGAPVVQQNAGNTKVIAVAGAQMALQALGWPLRLDGQYGPATAAAWVAAAKERKLDTLTGKADRAGRLMMVDRTTFNRLAKDARDALVG